MKGNIETNLFLYGFDYNLIIINYGFNFHNNKFKVKLKCEQHIDFLLANISDP